MLLNPSKACAMSDQNAAPARGPNCFQCRHFAVSWDPSLPYLCRSLGFKSRALPAIEVLRADGVFCRGFQAKAAVAPSAKQSAAAV